MTRHPFPLTRLGVTLLAGLIFISALSSVARADESPHAQADTFAAEAAALLPPAEAVTPQATAPADRITLGDWSAVIPWTPHIPVSAASLPDGRVLTFASNQRTTFPSGPEFTYAATWDPATGVFVEYNHPSHDMFCGGIATLPDGRVLVNGGRSTTVRSSIFDWRVNTWTRTSDMNDPRWYNTTVALPNGQAFTASGSGGSGTTERFDSASGMWSRLTGINWNLVLADPGYINIWHPFLLLAPDGRLIHFGPTDTMHWITTSGSGTMANTGTVVPGTHYPKEGAWVMYDEGRILVAGGGTNTTAISNGDGTTGTSSRSAYTVDVRTGTPVVTPAAPMTFARQFANAVVLPTGEVMVMGGNTSGLKFNDTGSILTPEIWNPTTGTWRNAADASVPRNYHSLALLLPDGRVLSAGGGLSGNSADHRDGQLYTPPTLFKTDGTLATRPALATAPASIGVGTKFDVTGTAGLQKFSFIKMSAITHCVDTDLRYLSLPFTETSAGVYKLTAHSSLNVMTPGYWMLFGVNSSGVYSVAKIILVDNINSVNIAIPGNQAAYVSQPASLQMIGSGPAGSVRTWSATGLPTGLTISPPTGLISGTPSTLGAFAVQVGLTDGNTSATANFTWTIQPVTFNQNLADFTGASGFTFNGNAALAANVLRLTSNVNNQVGSAYLTSPIAIGPNTSFSTRFVYRIHGTADGADGLTFVIQGNGPTAIGAGGGGLGYDGTSQSVAVEVDNYQGPGDPDANHLGILSNGDVAAHLTSYSPAWDLENEASQTIWVEYDGPANQLRVYAAPDNTSPRPASPVMTATVDLAALVSGGQAWFGFTAGTGGLNNNHDIESWSLTVNAFALPAQPLFAAPGNTTNVIGVAVNQQMQATDPNGDLLTWSATGLPTGLTINPASGLITGTPTVAGVFSPTVTVTDNNTAPVSRNFTWAINDLLTVQQLTGSAVAVGATVALNAQASGGLDLKYSWDFGDGTPATGFTSSPSTSHVFSAPGLFPVTLTVQDLTARQVSSSYHQGVYAALTAARPNASSSIIYETRAGNNARLWVVNPDNDSVTVFDAITRAKLSEINVGRAPRSLALAPDGRVWVANAESATITILQSDYAIAQTITLPRGSRPFGLVFDPAGLNAYVALETAGKILKLNPGTGATVATLDVGLNVRHLSVSANGAQLLATRFITPRVPGEETASPQTTVSGTNYGGEVLNINTTTFAVAGTMILQHSERPDSDVSARGIPNYLGAAVISPDGQSAWVPSKQDNIKRGTLRNGGQLTHDMSVRSIVSHLNLATQTEDLAGRVDFDNGGIASASAFGPFGIYLFTALEGSREVGVVDAVGRREILRIQAGRAPQGLVLSPDGRTLFVQNFMDRTITVHDLTALANGATAQPPAPVVLPCVTTEKLAANVLVGKQLFYDAQDNRLALEQYMSCASCHNDGGQDGRVWDFTQFGEGLRNTISLRGHRSGQGPLHWSGNFDEVQDFEGQIRNFAGGVGLMSDADFHTGTRDQTLGDPKAGISADLDALAAYVNSLTKNGDSPDRNQDGTFTSAALAGQTVFQQQNCAQCHAGPQFTDSALNVFHDVGTLKPSSGQRLGATLTGLDTPTLRGIWADAPYLHDGSAASIEAAVSAHNGVSLTPTEMSNLVAFLRQLDDGGSATPTVSEISDQLTTVNTPTAAFPFTIADADTPLASVTLTRDSSNPALVPVGNIVFAGTGADRTVTITPAPHETGTATITVTVSDGVLEANANFVVTVNPVVLTVTGITANNRIYDATTATTLNTASAVLVGVTGGDVVTLNTGSATGVFADKKVGNGKSVQVVGLTLGGVNAGNYTLIQPTATANITTKTLTVTGLVANDKVYNHTTAAILNVAGANLVGVLGGDTVTLQTAGAVGSFANKNVGSGKLVTVSGLTLGGADAGNYTLTQPTTTAGITPFNLLVTGITAANKPYDGTVAAVLSTGSAALATVFSGDAVALNTGGVTGTFANKNPGNGKQVTISGLTISGGDAANYTLTQPTTTADITAKTVTPVIAANNKPYDSTTTATLNSQSVSGTLGSEVVTLSAGAANFDTKNVGTGKTVTATALTLGGADAGNYVLSATSATALADITALSVTGSFTAANKVYDANTTATALTRSLSGVLAGDTANVSLAGGTASFANAAVAAGKAVTLTGASLSGSAAGNYTLGSVGTTTADIMAKTVTPVIVANNKPYDGTTTATLNNQSVTGTLGAEAVTLSAGAANFDTKNVGSGKTVTATALTLGGADAGNYVLSATSATALADITALSVTGNFTAANKVYDANTTATALTRSLSGVLAGDTANVSLTAGTASFATAAVGSGKTVSLTGASLSGSAAGNYTLGSVGTTTADIMAKTVTPVIVANNKPYDGTTTATLSGSSVTGTLGSERVTLSAGAANFDTKNVGTGKTVTATALILGGADAGNYMLSATSATALADITALSVTGSFTAANKVYDATSTATVSTRSLSGVLAGDTANVSLSGGTASFANAAVASGKTVTLSGASLSGSAAGNYTLSSVGTTTADITAKSVTPLIAANNKPYDGNTTATLSSQSVSGTLGSEVVTWVAGAANFDTKTVGTGKTVTATALTLAGADAGNYVLSATSATALADITALSVTGSFTAANKGYDATPTATVSTRTLNGVLAGDTANVSLTGGMASLANAGVGAGKTVTLTGASLSGSAAGNYTLGSVGTTTADITAKTVTPVIAANNKPYDGTTTATLSSRSVTGTLGAEVVTLSAGAANFDTRNVGTGKTVTATALTLGGADAGNYVLSATSATASADITALSVTGSFTAANKVYDATPTATALTRTLSGVLAGDTANVSLSGGTASFANAAVAAGKTVTLIGASLSGSAAENYTLGAVGTTTADITAKSVTPVIVANNKPYDGNTTATLSSQSVSGMIGSDVVTLSMGAANFDTQSVGTGKTVTATALTLSGADAGNYTLSATSASSLADISALSLTGNFTAANKVYDGATAATVATRTLNNVLPGDTANVSLTGGTASFANAAVASGKTVTLTGASLGGSAAGNYTLGSVGTTTADITAKSVTPVIVANNKPYDANTTATLSSRSVTGTLGSEVVTLVAGAANFDTKTVGTGKTVTATALTLGGADAGNYVLSATSATALADITALSVTGSFTAANKVYDANTTATALTRSLSGELAGDTANVSLTGGTASFANATVASGKTVSLTGASLSGSAAGNYTLGSVGTTTADITAKSLTPVIAANNKPYDGTTTASLSSQSVSGTLGVEVVTLNMGAANFDTKSVGMGKTVTATALTLSGADAANYSLNATTATALADITALSLTGNFTTANKPYDGNNTAAVATRTLNNVLLGDAANVSLTGGTATFANATVASGKTVSLSGASLSGSAAGNYTLGSVGTTTADITAKSVTPVIVANNKLYDGTTTATLSSQSVTGTLGAEVVTLGAGAANFDTKNVGSGKTVTATALTLGGADAGNYVLGATSATSLADITARTLTVSAVGVDREYDATTNATVTLDHDGVAGDSLTLSYGEAFFADKNVGAGKTVSVNGVTVGGDDAPNYTFASTTATTASITPVSLVVSADDQTRAYGAGNPTLTASYSGFVGAETLATSGVTGEPDLSTTATNSSPADDYPITAALGTLDAVNYTFTFAEGTLTIEPAGSVTLTSLIRLENNHARLVGTGGAGVVYTIQSSSDLVDWQDIGTATAAEDGSFEFEDANAAHLNRCFYRVLLP